MLANLLPFPIDAARIGGIALWSLALCWGFSPVSDRIFQQIHQWLSAAMGETATKGEEGPTVILASLLSILPFLAVGILVNYGVELGLGRSWAISVGVLACVGCGVYELGRRDGQASR